MMKRLRNVLLATSAMALLAACASDGNSGSGGGGGGGLGSTAVPELGLTGEGGATDALGVSALTDPLLGTTGLLGGGGDGQVGGAIPADALTPLSSQLEPVAEQIAAAVPLGLITDQVPALGVNGDGGLVDDLVGQDPLTGVVGSDGLVGSLLGSGNDGAVGNIIPEGTIPSLPTGSDPTAAVTGLVSTVTGALGGAGGLPTTGTPLDSVTGALGGLAGGGSDPTAAVTGAVATVTSTLGSSGLPVDTSALGGVLTTVTGALPK